MNAILLSICIYVCLSQDFNTHVRCLLGGVALESGFYLFFLPYTWIAKRNICCQKVEESGDPVANEQNQNGNRTVVLTNFSSCAIGTSANQQVPSDNAAVQIEEVDPPPCYEEVVNIK